MTTRTFKVTRGWENSEYTGGQEDGVIFVDGRRIGGTYWCGPQPRSRRWASYGPAGALYGERGFPTRDAAEAAQVREYATNPDEYDRLNDQANALLAADEAERQARHDAETARLDAEDRLRRLGDDEPGPTVWTCPAFHHMYAPAREVRLVHSWLRFHGLEGEVSGLHPIRVERRATRTVIVYERPTDMVQLAAAMGQNVTHEGWLKAVETHVTTLVEDPPTITVPDRPDLHPVFAEHRPVKFPLIDFGRNVACSCCTKNSGDVTSVIAWPCDVVETAIEKGA